MTAAGYHSMDLLPQQCEIPGKMKAGILAEDQLMDHPLFEIFSAAGINATDTCGCSLWDGKVSRCGHLA